MRFKFLFIAGISVAVLAYVLLRHPALTNGQTSTVDSSYESTTSSNDTSSPSLDPISSIETPAEETERPKELVSSIHDYDLAYRQKAIKAAEDMIQHHPHESYNRWSVIRVDPLSILNGSYLEESAMPKTIAVSPFPDTSFIADQTEYSIFEESHGAIWRGTIRDSDHGQIEVTIVGATEVPGFVIQVNNYPNPPIVITPTDTLDVYVAIEANPNLTMSLD